jgi:hypothetical protein
VQTFDSAMLATITAKIPNYNGLAGVMAKLREFRGFGDRSAVVLTKAYGQAIRGEALDLTDDERPVFTRITNLWHEGLSDLL